MLSTTATTKKIFVAIEKKDLSLLKAALNEPDADVNLQHDNLSPLHAALAYGAGRSLIQLILNHSTFSLKYVEIYPFLIEIIRRNDGIITNDRDILNDCFSHPQFHQAFEESSDVQMTMLWNQMPETLNTSFQYTILFKILMRSFKKNRDFTFEEAKTLLPDFEKIEKAREVFDHSRRMSIYPKNFIFLFGFSIVLEQFYLEKPIKNIPVSNKNETENDKLIRYARNILVNPLHRAVDSFYLEKHLHLVEFLSTNIEKNSLNKQIQPFSQTPLHAAISQRKLSLVRFLLTQKEIDPTILDHDGNTPLHIAMGKDHDEIVTLLLQHPEVAKKIHGKNRDGNTPLNVGLKSGALKTCKVLLESELFTDFYSSNHKGETVLHCVCSQRGNDEILPLLLEKKQIPADMLNAKNKDNLTPLELAVNHDDIEMFKLFLNYLKLHNQSLTIRGIHSIPDPHIDPKGFASHEVMKKKPRITAYYAALNLLIKNPRLTREEVFATLKAQNFPQHETWSEETHQEIAFDCALKTIATYPPDLFALIVFLCDGLLEKKNREIPFEPDDIVSRNQRFFTIMQKLPMELQMMVCHQVYDEPKESILQKDSEAAFKGLALTVG